MSRMLEPKRTSGLHSPSGVSPYVPVDQAHEPDVNAGGRLRGVLQPTLDSTVTETANPAVKGRGTKRTLHRSRMIQLQLWSRNGLMPVTSVQIIMALI